MFGRGTLIVLKMFFTGLYPFVVISYCCLQLYCLQLVCNFLQSPPIFQFVLVCFHLQLFFIIHCSQNDCFHLLLICSFKVIFHLFPFVVPLSIIEQSSKLWNSYLQLLCLCLQFYYQNVQLVVLLSVQEGSQSSHHCESCIRISTCALHRVRVGQ